jgi:hypothetical protein
VARSNRRAAWAATIIALLAVAGIFAAIAFAKTVQYAGEAKHLKPGQSKGLPVLVVLKLRGNGCPKGDHCFDHAKAFDFGAASYAWPDCPDVLDSASDLNKTVSVGKKAPHRFHAEGTTDSGDHMTINGYFPHHGRTAAGWFSVDLRGGCHTGRIDFNIPQD